MDVGELLREARRRHGLTQKQLAIRARTSQAAISRIERGLVSPTVETLGKLLAMMNEELVLDARELDWGHDVTLIQGNLELDVGQRLAQAEAYAEFAQLLRDAGRAVSPA
jgi:transcriptional regulator with XRE-family HTH domain